MRNQECEERAKLAAERVRQMTSAWADPEIGLVLGTGWADALQFEEAREIPFGDIPGFEVLGQLPGHARRLVVGKLAGVWVLALRGRVHLNEAPQDPQIPKMVRLQTEMLFQLGVKTLVVTSAVGALRGALEVGQIAVVNGFVTLFAPDMPLYAGEFCSPEDTLASSLRDIALMERGGLGGKEIGHVMVRGPFFEGRRFDKALLAKTGVGVVGMSMLPEACVAALYDVPVLGLGFVTNDDVAAHSHEENLAAAKQASAHLGGYLTRIVAHIGGLEG